ncbi:MAG: signal peptidase I, partial [Chlamydiae bacterium]|nr:signal peptidase I [Chlamydiota bacterium]
MGKKLIHMMESVFPKSPLERAFHFILTLCIALGLTLLIRQLWFELYEIPTGSMRPTLKEKDRLIVSKTTFGINTPFTADHLLFSPQEVRRSGIAIFTAEGLDVKDPNTRYFYLFPGKKQYIKRMIGKPGDTLYFYGGLIYGMDSEGHDISKELQLERLSYVDHIPFLQFEGRVLTPSAPNAQGVFSPVLIKQTNEPIAQLQALPHGAVQGSLLPPFKDTLQDYFSLWGIENFG